MMLHCTSVDGVAVARCGELSVLSCFWQQPMFAMSPQLPCMERQQALSA